MQRAAVTVAVLGVLAALAGGAGAGASSKFDFQGIEKAPPGLDSRLAAVAQAQRLGGPTAAIASARAQRLDVAHDRVRVVVETAAGGLAAAQRSIKQSGGAAVLSAHGLVEALVPPGALHVLAASPGVTRVRPPAMMLPEAVDEGVVATNANIWQVAGNDGTGITIAIIDLGFTGYTAALAGASYTTIDHCDGDFATATEHGAAVAEIVHQLAPAAHLLLICVASEVGLAAAEQDAIANNAKIVNHSVGWFGTSRGDGTGGAGTPDAIVADAEAHGILWVNAAGNQAEQHWSGPFNPLAGEPDLHSFAGSDVLNTVTIHGGEQVCALLKWDAWPKTTEDFDLLLVRESDYTIVDFSADDQASGPLEPTESVCYTNPGATALFGLAIARYSASTTPRFDLYFLGSSSLEYRTAPGSIVEPASSPAALAVGADCWQSAALEAYSAQGPTIDGRVKPDLVAPDSVSTMTYGSFTNPNCGSSGFAGTSAAAPQVAGAAALLIQRTPSLTPFGLRGELLESTQRHTGASPNSQVGVGPLWLASNPSGGRVLYSSPFYGDIKIAGSDGSGQSTLLLQGAGNYSHPSWSPDGSKFAVTRNTGGGSWEVDVANNDGSAVSPIFSTSATNLYHAAWAPDDSKVAFDTGAQIKVVPAVGGTATTLRDGVSPAWSPSSGKIAFVANGTGSSNLEIWTMNADGSNPVQLTTGASLGGVNVDVGSPAWSPDGIRIAYANSAGIWAMDADGQNQHQLVPPPGGGGAYFDPVWSPDGKTIAFPHWSGGLHEALADGSRETTVAVIDVTGPSWTSANPGASLSSTGAPIIGGDARVGEPIEAGAGSWAGAEPFAFSYSWQRCNSAGLSCAAIAGAGGDTYTPAAADVGSTVKATVTATSPFVVGSVSSTTPTMGPIAAARPYSDVPPTINGSTTVGQTLLAANDAAAWTGGPSFSFRWRRCSGGGACGDIGGAVGTTYTLTTSDEGHTIRLAVTGTNAGGSSTVTSRATAAIAAAPGGGGGGGGGGGVGSIPDLKVTLSATKTTVQPNDETDFTVIVANNGGAGALQTHLAIVLPATMTLLGAPAYDVGSGCTGTQSIDCFLDYVANGGKATVRFAVHVGGTGAQTVTATATSDREANPADNSASLVITVATSTPPPPPPPPPTKGVTKVGTAHNDVLRGTNRNDTLRGMGGNDTLWGLGGNDLLVGGTGRDTLYGGGGNDTLLAREGQRDVVNCGTGRDTATVDKVDVVKGCETVRRR